VNFFVLGPLAIGLILTVMRAYVSRGNVSGGSSVYRYDPAMVAMILVMAIILVSVPLWLPFVQPGKDNGIVFLGCSFIATVGFIGCFWLFTFRVHVMDDFIEYGAVLKKKIYFKNIDRIKVARNDTKGSIALYPSRGFKAVFTYTLNDYAALKIDILKRIPSTIKVDYW
jgi:hypothetical protein